MGKRGPAKEPTHLRVLKGTAKAADLEDEPTPAARPVEAPDEFVGDALEIWNTYAPDLIAKKVLTAWDVEAFSAWCDAAMRLRTARRHLDEEGEVVEADVFDRNGTPTGTRRVKNPWMQVWKDANEVLARLGSRFGLTPSDRSQIEVHSDGSREDRAAALLS